MDRRAFTIGCCASIAALAGGRITDLVFAAEQAVARDILVVVFLRGGCDGLNLVAPSDDANYADARGSLRVFDSGANAGLPLANALAGVDFRLHPSASALKELYDSQALAIVHAAGLTNGTRSHFEAMDFMERGTPGIKNTTTGWITRHLSAIGAQGTVPAAAIQAALPASLLGNLNAITTTSLAGFKLNGHWKYGPQQQTSLRTIYGGTSKLHAAGRATLNTVDSIQAALPRDAQGKPLPYIPENGVEYPSDYYVSGLSSSLQVLAELIKLDMGLQVATIDFGGWDTHEQQSGVFTNQVDGLARALGAFYNDLSRYHSRLTVVVMSEFGRRLRANQSGGTDHGHGNVMMVLGGNVNGGTMYGSWPGLATEQLDNGADLAITTDYRQVLSEILLRRLANPNIAQVFPGFVDGSPLNIVRSAPLPPLNNKVLLPLVAEE